jgi:hypothetical protein
MATLEQLEAALIKADAAGNTDDARQLAAVIGRARQNPQNLSRGQQIAETELPGPGLADQAIGVGEAALAIGTGATGGALGMMGGALGGLAGAVQTGEFGSPESAQKVVEASHQGAESLTYAPRSEIGQQYLAALAGPLSELAVIPAFAAESAALAAALKGVPQGVRNVASDVSTSGAVQRAVGEVSPLIQRAKGAIAEKLGRTPDDGMGGPTGVGAAELPRESVKIRQGRFVACPHRSDKGSCVKGGRSVGF